MSREITTPLDVEVRERYGLVRNAYSPRLLSEDLQGIVKKGFICAAIRKGHLKAQRFGGKNLIILREDAETWLSNLPSALVATNLGGSTGKRAQRGGKAKAMTAREKGIASLRSKRTASRRASLH